MSSLREDARACLAAAIAAVEPERLVADSLRAEPLAGTGPVHVVGFGKAAAAMARGARTELGSRLARGVLIAPQAAAVAGFDVHVGGHPVPNAEGVRGARALLDLARGLGPADHLLVLVSGGGSALATLPAGELELADVQTATAMLLRAGASIDDVNCVRKHLDALKGGRLALAAAPARVTALVVSDVVGNRLDVIASGPVSPDATTREDAWAVLRRHAIAHTVPDAVRAHLDAAAETSPSVRDSCFDSVAVRIVGNNAMAVQAAAAEARRRGYAVQVVESALTGEARGVGRALGRRVRSLVERASSPACIVAGGETTVIVRGSGRGGRNQELVLGAAPELDGLDGVLVASAGTDGIDGPTDAAGAWADGTTLARARGLGLDAARALAGNDAYPFFAALGDLIVTGPTGTNVMDVQLALVRGTPTPVRGRTP